MVPVSAYASVALEECRRSALFMTGPKIFYIQMSIFLLRFIPLTWAGIGLIGHVPNTLYTLTKLPRNLD
jgi:hypothetical protein